MASANTSFGSMHAKFEPPNDIFAILNTIFLLLRQKRISSNKKGNDLKVANSERLIGLIGIVTEEIPEFGTGSVKVENETWMATSESGKQISLNETVSIKKISGVKLVVEIAKKD